MCFSFTGNIWFASHVFQLVLLYSLASQKQISYNLHSHSYNNVYAHTSIPISYIYLWVKGVYIVNSLVCIALLILVLNILYFAIFCFFVIVKFWESYIHILYFRFYFILFLPILIITLLSLYFLSVLELLSHLNFHSVGSIKFYLILS